MLGGIDTCNGELKDSLYEIAIAQYEMMFEHLVKDKGENNSGRQAEHEKPRPWVAYSPVGRGQHQEIDQIRSHGACH